MAVSSRQCFAGAYQPPQPPEHNAKQISLLLRLFRRTKAFDSVMDIQERKPRRTETSEEREARLDKEHRKALDRALAEQDALDDMVRRSIAMHGA